MDILNDAFQVSNPCTAAGPPGWLGSSCAGFAPAFGLRDRVPAAANVLKREAAGPTAGIEYDQDNVTTLWERRTTSTF